MSKKQRSGEEKIKSAGARRTKWRSFPEETTGNGATAHQGNGAAADVSATEREYCSLLPSPDEYKARVARKAFELFERRGRRQGGEMEDWLEAERLVKEDILREVRS